MAALFSGPGISHGVLQGGPKSEWRNKSFGDYEPSTVSVSPSVVKCGHVCREQTYAHSGIEPSRLAKGFLQGGRVGQKNSRKKIEFLTICRRATMLYFANVFSIYIFI